jgi:hypothetical protein
MEQERCTRPRPPQSRSGVRSADTIRRAADQAIIWQSGRPADVMISGRYLDAHRQVGNMAAATRPVGGEVMSPLRP